MRTGVTVANLADGLKDSKKRDAVLKQVVEVTARINQNDPTLPAASRYRPGKQFVALAELMIKDLARKQRRDRFGDCRRLGSGNLGQ